MAKDVYARVIISFLAKGVKMAKSRRNFSRKISKMVENEKKGLDTYTNHRKKKILNCFLSVVHFRMILCGCHDHPLRGTAPFDYTLFILEHSPRVRP